MPLPKSGNHGRPRTARQEKLAKAKIVAGGDGKKMVGKKMARQGGGSVHDLPATHVPAILLSIWLRLNEVKPHWEIRGSL